MNRTKIEWALNPDGTPGYTWNPISGCLNGCEYCYARKLANTRLKERYLANRKIAPTGTMIEGAAMGEKALLNPFHPREWFDRRERALEGSKPKGVFVCDMSDLFGIGIPESWTECVLETIKVCPEHRFYLLTKQPQNLIKFSPFPDNCWVGVTATNSYIFINAIDCLSEVEAKVKYISFEPLLDWAMPPTKTMFSVLDWVIIGAQTSKSYWDLVASYPNETNRIMKFGRQWTFQPRIEWVEEIVSACDKAGISVFLKDNLWPLFDGSHYAVPLWAFSSKSTLRQEMPK